MKNFINNMSLPLFLTVSLTAFDGLAAIENQADENEDKRVPTEELVEGLKSRDGRWFEVEIIVFAHENAGDLREAFDNEVKNVKPNRYWPLLDDTREYDVSALLSTLPSCIDADDPLNIDVTKMPPNPEQFFQSLELMSERLSSVWQSDELMCLTPDEYLPPYWQLMVQGQLAPKKLKLNLPEESQITGQVTGIDYDDFHDVYLIAPQNLQLLDKYQALQKNRATRPLLHIGWRQPGLAKNKAMPVYLYGGNNWTEQFHYDGSAKPEEPEELVEEEITDLSDDDSGVLTSSVMEAPFSPEKSSVEAFMEKLQQGAVVDLKTQELVFPDTSELPQETWEFDGFITVHLNHYLFLDAEFNYRQLGTQVVDTELVLAKGNLLEQSVKTSADIEIHKMISDEDVADDSTGIGEQFVEINYLQTYALKQNRRTYSGDLHYLDHPKLGILFQIRKYRH